MKLGDWLLTIIGLVAVLALSWGYWWRESGSEVTVRSHGRLFARLDLATPQSIEVPGPLGLTRIDVAGGRVRIARDPSPRQLCVQQGWLSKAGQTAICLPNRVSLEVNGGGKRYDTLGY